MFVSFTKIKDFKSVVRDISHVVSFDGLDAEGKPIYKSPNKIVYPTIRFTGTTKLHGTNASIVKDFNDGSIYYQSRRNIITPTNDNHGFAFFAESRKEIFKEFFNKLSGRISSTKEQPKVSIFGEFCGAKIQKGVAISGLEKMFVIFAVKVIEGENNYYLPSSFWKDLKSHEDKIYNAYDFKTYELDIDFSKPKDYINILVKYTNEVEEECPVGKYFGRIKDKDNTCGEGLVWEGWFEGKRYIFKTKGEKHSSSKVKKIVSIDVEKVNSIREFVEYSVTENRLNQAIEQVFTINSIEPDRKYTGDFLRWLINDITTEEIDVLSENGLEPKEVNKEISKKAKNWFFDYLDSQIGV